MSTNNLNLPAVVVIAFNRPNSLLRLLDSLKNASYPNNDITLIISIDKDDNNLDVLTIAKNFIWEFGNKKVIYHKKNLGLRSHVVKSMSLTEEYGSIIMLEDDLFVAKDFYNFSIQSLKFCDNNDKIAGISLYNHQLNVNTSQNFSPIEDGYDNWYFQFASSWGQAWNKKQIDSFLNWYFTNPDIDYFENIPKNVRNWSKKSWLKYFISYAILKNKFFLYPKISLTTNFGDQGTHVDIQNTHYQVPLNLTENKKYIFSHLATSNSVYDAFFENVKLGESLNLNSDEITIDLYGSKTEIKTKYLLTPRILKHRIEKRFGRKMKPHDYNILNNIKGKEFFLYDTSIFQNNNNKANRYNLIDYNKKVIALSDAILLLKNIIIKRVKAKL